MSQAWDVIVVGGGPGGALAAKTCAENGLSTLLIEKKRMPRDKCCTGMVMAPWGQDIVAEEFGEYPPDVLEETITLLGYALHVPGAPVRTLDVRTPTTWRRTLDTWMCEKAREAGAELWDSAPVVGVAQTEHSCVIDVKRDGERVVLRCEFAIGADGGNSLVRREVFPELKPLLTYGYRECYDVTLDLPEKRFNIFATLGTDPLFFVHEKSGCTFLEGVALEGTFEETIARGRQFLVDNCGLDPALEPSWRDGCAQAAMQQEVASGGFRPARGNVLMVGDAAGLNVPVTGEGLAMSLRSGLDAARAVIEARKRKEPVEKIYLEIIDGVLARFSELGPVGRGIGEALAGGDPGVYSETMLKGWDRALRIL